MARIRPLDLSLALLLLAVGLTSCGERKGSLRPTLPENNLTYAISHFVVPIDRDHQMTSMKQVMQTVDELQSGTPFPEVASRVPAGDPKAAPGGWMGFVQPREADAFTGAYQAVQPGQYGGPVQNEGAMHFFFRHTFEDGRRLERERVIPAYGFFIPYGGDPASTKEKSMAQGKEAWEKVSRGELTMAQAAEEYGARASRADAFINNLKNAGPDKEMYGILEKIEPGTMAPLSQLTGALFVARRGVYFRSQVRHILIQHVESANRPLTVSRSKTEAKALAEKVLAELKDGSLSWSDAVHRHSDDVQTAGLLGWIGSFTNGTLKPDFEEAIQATEPGSIAEEVLVVDDGYHILYRVN